MSFMVIITLLSATASVGLLAFVLKISGCKAPYSGGTITTSDDDAIKALVGTNRWMTSREMVNSIVYLRS